MMLFGLVLALLGALALAALVHNKIKRNIGPVQDQSMIFLGSGGHTGEMLLILEQLDFANPAMPPPRFVYSEGDDLSVRKLQGQLPGMVGSKTSSVPRARMVGQGWVSSVFTSLVAIRACLALLSRHHPRIVVSNGPATGLLLLATARALRLFGLKTRLIYIESLARVERLSLSGKLAYRFVDRFLVQWPDLKRSYPYSEYLGLLV